MRASVRSDERRYRPPAPRRPPPRRARGRGAARWSVAPGGRRGRRGRGRTEAREVKRLDADDEAERGGCLRFELRPCRPASARGPGGGWRGKMPTKAAGSNGSNRACVGKEAPSGFSRRSGWAPLRLPASPAVVEEGEEREQMVSRWLRRSRGRPESRGIEGSVEDESTQTLNLCKWG